LDNDKENGENGNKTTEETFCFKCGLKLPHDRLTYHLVRKGLDPSFFPFLKYEKTPLCPECYKTQLRVDKFEKVLAIITLGIVLYLLLLGYLFLFGI